MVVDMEVGLYLLLVTMRTVSVVVLVLLMSMFMFMDQWIMLEYLFGKIERFLT